MNIPTLLSNNSSCRSGHERLCSFTLPFYLMLLMQGFPPTRSQLRRCPNLVLTRLAPSLAQSSTTLTRSLRVFILVGPSRDADPPCIATIEISRFERVPARSRRAHIKQHSETIPSPFAAPFSAKPTFSNLARVVSVPAVPVWQQPASNACFGARCYAENHNPFPVWRQLISNRLAKINIAGGNPSRIHTHCSRHRQQWG